VEKMKILMIDDDSDSRLFALFAFKDMNVAHAVDFVGSNTEMVNYFSKRLATNSQLPDLVLIDTTEKSNDHGASLSRILADPKLKHLKTITYSISASSDKSLLSVNEEGKLVEPSKDDQLTWILTDICKELSEKPGWKYSIEPSRYSIPKVENY